ncbi:hypothetical protein IMY05_C1888004900 [Salix suchowensis]|nr:hypothetical protein IMY05_C1888004900 [Salix suchowensis]
MKIQRNIWTLDAIFRAPIATFERLRVYLGGFFFFFLFCFFVAFLLLLLLLLLFFFSKKPSYPNSNSASNILSLSINQQSNSLKKIQSWLAQAASDPRISETHLLYLIYLLSLSSIFVIWSLD